MNKGTKTVIGVVLVVAILLVAVGYAAVSSKDLTISTTATAAVDTENNFKIGFMKEGTSTTGGGTAGKVVTATVASEGVMTASLNVTGLTLKDEFVTATYTIKNFSADLSAELAAPVIGVDNNNEYFEVTANYGDKTTLAAGETTTVTVKVKLIKTPIDPTADLDANITVTMKATPKNS